MKKDIMKKDIMKKDIMKKDVIKKDVIKKDVIKKDIKKKDIIKKDVIKKDVIKKDVIKKDVIKKDVIKKDINYLFCNSNKIIIHVYNSNYNYGLGDFIRGSVLLAQFAKDFNINFKINTAGHSISKYLYIYTIEEEPEILEKDTKIISMCENYRAENAYIMIYALIKEFTNSNENNLYIQTNVIYRNKQISDDIKKYINSVFKFKPQYYETAKELFNLNKYNILHIRCLDKDFDTNFEDKNLLLKIKKLKLSNNTFIMSNNYELKKKLNNIFGFYFIDNKACHSAISANISNNTDLESTIIDYIILSNSSKTFCISYYNNCSGFSKHCSVLNNIPYIFVK